jgi:hypothetical protein
MSGPGVGHVQPSSLKPSLGTGQCRLGLSHGGARVRPDMSDPGARHVQLGLLEPDLGPG